MVPIAATVNLSLWQNFYQVVGSSAGALIGLQFVVIALLANMHRRPDAASINAFSTPTVFHFSEALAISAIMNAPWQSLTGVSVALVIGAVGGLAYSATVFGNARRQTAYKPILEDWLWYALLPCGVYATLTVASLFLLLSAPAGALSLFVIAASALALLLLGIRNAWDTVTHLVVQNRSPDSNQPV